MAFHHHKQISKIEATPTEKAVLQAMAIYADKGGKCWPSQSTLAKDTGFCRMTISRAVKSLKSKGWIEVKNTPLSCVYTLTLAGTARLTVCQDVTR